MEKFVHVESIKAVAKRVHRHNSTCEPGKEVSQVRYRGTVKIHGTNAGVVCAPGLPLQAQSRNRELTLENDNMGFAAFVVEHEEALREYAMEVRNVCGLSSIDPVVLYGEWCGPGIQKGVGVARLPYKQFAVFAARLRDGAYLDPFKSPDFCPPIHPFVRSVIEVEPIHVVLDFVHKAQIADMLARVEEQVAKIDRSCPWAAMFDIEGPGEGLVFWPVWGADGYPDPSELVWKAKGAKHKEVTAAVSRDVPLAEVQHLTEFCARICPEARLNKGLDYMREMAIPFEKRSTGQFLKWIGQDLKRECADLAAEEGFEWKAVASVSSAIARDFFFRTLLTSD